jgi:hypothetical protein
MLRSGGHSYNPKMLKNRGQGFIPRLLRRRGQNFNPKILKEEAKVSVFEYRGDEAIVQYSNTEE